MPTIHTQAAIQLSDDYEAWISSAEEYYSERLSKYEEAFKPYLPVLAGVGADNFGWAVYSDNRVDYILETVKELDVVKLKIDLLPRADSSGQSDHGRDWRIDVIHTRGIFAFILPFVRADETVKMYPC